MQNATTFAPATKTNARRNKRVVCRDTKTPNVKISTAEPNRSTIDIAPEPKPNPIVGSSTLRFNGVVSVIEQLVTARENWEQNAFRKANDELYDLLAQCLSLYEQMAGNSDNAKQRRQMLDAYIKEKDYSFKSSTHGLTKIVKCVFGSERRRVSAYGIALQCAHSAGVKSADLPNYIRQKGGVEELRLEGGSNSVTTAEKLQAATTLIASKSIGSFSAPQLSKSMDATNIDKQVLLVGVWQADGSVLVQEVVKSESAVKAALLACYSAGRQSIAELTASSGQVSKADAVDELIKQAAQKAN